MHGNLPRLPEYGGRGVEVARLVRVGHENVVPEHAARPHEIAAARTPGPGESLENAGSRAPSSRPVRVRHAARHARSSDARPRHRTSLSIRSAERRRWAADLTGPGSGGLVIYVMGGIGKSTLAAQIATRVSRLQSDRVITVVNGEVPASAPWPPRRTSSSWTTSTTTCRRIRAGGRCGTRPWRPGWPAGPASC